MFDYMAKYDDMSIFSVTIEEYSSQANEALDIICQKMNFNLEKTGTFLITYNSYGIGMHTVERNFFLYKNNDDIRSFLLAVQGVEPYYHISIKCKAADKNLFFNSIWTQILQTEEDGGPPCRKIEKYPDWLHTASEPSQNPVTGDLKLVGLI